MVDSFEQKISQKIFELFESEEPAHDWLHFQRVVKVAKEICANEKGRVEIVVPAAWLHDLVVIPKNDPRRSQASRLSATAAIQFLREINYPEIFYDDISHAIEAHSFSAQIEPRTLEAKIVQDADRLDGLGAIGIARCFATAGVLKRPFYSVEDSFCETRSPNDSKFTIDHFYSKLFRVAETLQTSTGRSIGKERVEFMQTYLGALAREISFLSSASS